MTHTPTHMNNPKITRATLPALLAGLFILAACGGSVLPIPGPIATESTDVANKAESNAPDSTLLSVGEQEEEQEAKSAPPAVNPIVKKQVQVKKQAPAPAPIVPTPDSPKQVKKQEQIPAPVFEVAVAPARPPQRSFSTEPVTSTDSVTQSDTTASQTVVRTAPIVFADWTGSFAGTLPSRATTTTTTTTPNTITKYNGGLLVTFTDKSLVNKVDDTILTYTSEVLKANGEAHADGDRIAFTTDADGYIIATSKDGLPMFSESEMVYISQLVKRNGEFPVIMDNPLPATITTSGARNQFLQGLRGSLDERPLEEDGRVGLVTNRGGLNLATATNNGIALGGDATDGVSFFRGFGAGTVVNQDTKSTTGNNYAGLYSGTDLGKPLGLTFRGETSATWKGHIRTLGYFNFDTDIDLVVDFDTKDLTVREFINPTNAKEHLSIAAEYTDDGVISGTIIIDADGANFGIEDEYGFVTGLIGAQGAVAAFLSSGHNSQGGRINIENAQGTKENIEEGDHQFGYAGGFVARPAPLPPTVVDASDLLNYASIPTTIAGLSATPGRGFLRIEDGADLDTTGAPDRGNNPLTFTPRRDFVAGSAGFGDGYTFINETGYVAMLPTTDLGAARPVGSNQPTDASWDGRYFLTSSSGSRALLAPITFTINFETGRLTGSADRPLDDGETISILADFGANGVMSGSFGTTSGSIQTTNTSVIGLIGEEGLVGIMHGVNAGVALAGGFTASPPSE